MAGNAAAPADTSTGTPEEAGSAFEALGLVDGADEEEETDEADSSDEDTEADESGDDTEDRLTDEDDESDEDEGEDDEDPDEGKPAPKTPAKPTTEEPVFTIELPDGTKQGVTKVEAEKGYLRTQDYTRKTMALAEQRKEVEALTSQYKTVLKAYDEHLGKIVSQEPDWDTLRAQDPEQYLLKKDEWNEAQKERAIVAQENDRLAKEAQKKQQAEMETFIQAELTKLHEKLPSWKDPKVSQREIRAIHKGLKDQYLFSADEVAAGLTDHRLVLMVRDALLYRDSKARAKTKVAPAAPTRTLRPGPAATTTNSGKRLREARARLNESGSAEDAGSAFEALGIV